MLSLVVTVMADADIRLQCAWNTVLPISKRVVYGKNFYMQLRLIDAKIIDLYF